MLDMDVCGFNLRPDDDFRTVEGAGVGAGGTWAWAWLGVEYNEAIVFVFPVPVNTLFVSDGGVQVRVRV
jgi:hypothetical protein